MYNIHSSSSSSSQNCIGTLPPPQHDRLPLMLPLKIIPRHIQSQCVVHEELLLQHLARWRLQLLQRLAQPIALLTHLGHAQCRSQDYQSNLKRVTKNR